MSSRRFRRKYQTGGSILPSFQGAQVLGQPQRIAQDVRPIAFDPNSTFQALRTQQDNFRTALSQADFNRRERQDAWQKERQNRDYLNGRLTQLQKSMVAGQDQLTKLDLNIPQQRQLSGEMRRGLEEINANSAAILTDNSLTPAERGQRLNENIIKAQGIFSNPKYVAFVQNNTIANKMYDGIAEAAAGGKTLIDPIAANANIELTSKFQRGEIDRVSYFSGVRNYTLDPKTVDKKEAQIDKYINDSLDPEKAATNWEQYKGDDAFLVFKEQFTVPDEDTQVETVFNLYKNDDNWLKVQEARGNRAFLGDDGFVDDEKLKNHIRRKIQLIRGSLGAQGKTLTVDVDVNRRPAQRSSGGGGGASRPTTLSERQNEAVRKDLNAAGYDVIAPSILNQLSSGAEALRILETPDADLEEADLTFKRDLERSIKPTSATSRTTPSIQDGSIPGQPDLRTPAQKLQGRAPATRNEWAEYVTLDDGGFPLFQGLVVGDNNGAAPELLGRNLGFYTNNPLNVKGSDRLYPVIKRYDRNDKEGGPKDTIFHRVFPTVQHGIAEGIDMLNRYKNGENETFVKNLKADDKTIEDATIDDLYRTWATGANDVNIQKIADEMGVTPDTKLSDVDVNDLFFGVLSVENDKMYEELKGVKLPKPGQAPPQTPEAKINAIKEQKRAVEESAQADTPEAVELTKQQKRMIEKEEENLANSREHFATVKKLGGGETVDIEIGPPTVIPPSGPGGRPFTSTNRISVRKSKADNTYNIIQNGRVLRNDYSEAQVERFLKIATGKTRTQIRNITPEQEAVSVETSTPSGQTTPSGKPAASTAKKQQKDIVSKYY